MPLELVRHDPLSGFKFRVHINDFGEIGFQKVSGLSEETEVVEYREGDDPSTARKLPGLTKYGNVTLSKGLGTDSTLVKWREQVANIGMSGLRSPDGQANFRKNVAITLMDKEGNAVRTWVLQAAWPAALNFSDLDAESGNVVIESLVLTHEGLLTERSSIPRFRGMVTSGGFSLPRT